MNARINQDNQVIDVKYAIPHDFNKDGVIIPHYSHAFSPEIWYQDGWRDVLIPEIDKTIQRYGDPIYDEAQDVCVLTIINTVIPAFNQATEMLGPKYYDTQNGIDTYTVIPIPQAELDAIAALMAKREADRLLRLSTLSKYQFLCRFTTAEKETIYGLENTNIGIHVWLETFRVCDEINLMEQNTIDGINSLEVSGVLAVGRAAEILNNNP